APKGGGVCTGASGAPRRTKGGLTRCRRRCGAVVVISHDTTAKRRGVSVFCPKIFRRSEQPHAQSELTDDVLAHCVEPPPAHTHLIDDLLVRKCLRRRKDSTLLIVRQHRPVLEPHQLALLLIQRPQHRFYSVHIAPRPFGAHLQCFQAEYILTRHVRRNSLGAAAFAGFPLPVTLKDVLALSLVLVHRRTVYRIVIELTLDVLEHVRWNLLIEYEFQLPSRRHTGPLPWPGL